ncbi:MAG TPA: hypothetical protein PLM16_01665 [Candidatus Woesebacteria bacterium]|nr:hypothetical protein [Candidatus Woesebacteria bacterium]
MESPVLGLQLAIHEITHAIQIIVNGYQTDTEKTLRFFQMSNQVVKRIIRSLLMEGFARIQETNFVTQVIDQISPEQLSAHDKMLLAEYIQTRMFEAFDSLDTKQMEYGIGFHLLRTLPAKYLVPSPENFDQRLIRLFTSKPELLLPFVYDYVHSATSFYRAANPDHTQYLGLQTSLMSEVFKSDIITQIFFNFEIMEIERLLQVFEYLPSEEQEGLIVELEGKLAPHLTDLFKESRQSKSLDSKDYYHLLLMETMINQPRRELIERGCKFEYDLLSAKDKIVEFLNNPTDQISPDSLLPPPITPPDAGTQNPGIALAA